MDKATIYIAILLTLILAILFTACDRNSLTQEEDHTEMGDDIHISLSPSGANFHDDKVKELRVMAFDHTSGELIYNIYNGFSDEMGKDSIRIHLELGTYDFVFIANESSDVEVHEELTNFGMGPFSNYETLEDLYNHIAWADNAFSANKHIPMSHIEKGVEIIGNRTFKLSDNTLYTDKIWPVKLTRMAVRLDLKFRTLLTEKKETFEKLLITQIPKTVPILQQKFDGSGAIINGGTGNFDLTTDREILLADGENGGWEEEIDNSQSPSVTYMVWKKTRIILPATMFDPVQDKSQGIVVKAIYTTGNPDGGVPGLHTPGTTTAAPDYTPGQGPYNYTLPRNTYLKFTGNIVDYDIILDAITVNSWGAPQNIGIED